MKFVFRIEGIDCANCGAKIERALENDKMFDEAYLNFMLKKIEVHTKESDEKRVEERVRQIATRVESGVTLSRIDTGYRGEVEVRTPEEKHEHAHGEACGCGGHDHEHKHEVKHEHTHGEGCGCGGHDHGQSHEDKHEHAHGDACG